MSLSNDLDPKVFAIRYTRGDPEVIVHVKTSSQYTFKDRIVTDLMTDFIAVDG